LAQVSKIVKTYTDLDHFQVPNPVVTIGTFDGVHLGHRKVLDRLKEIAAEIGGETVLFTFYPHPRQVLTPEEHNLRLLTTPEEKIRLLETAGIDHLIIFPFSLAFSKLTYEEFVKNILVEKLKTACLVVGYDHKFGKNREGSFDYLQTCARQYGFRIERLDALLLNEVDISSTKIRESLEQGHIRKANQYLGYPFTLHGRVVEGQKLGRQIGFPTANIESSDINKLIPGYGVYAAFIEISGKTYRGMMNIGTRPTFNQNADNRSIEVNIFDFEEDIYGKEISLLFIDKIRNEQKFSSPAELVRQLHRDRETAQKILKEAEK